MSNIVSDAFRLNVRESVGGGASRALRRANMIPAVVYGDGKENIHIAVDPRDVNKGLDTTGFYAKIYELNINGKKERTLVRDIQFNPVTDQPIHVDFQRVAKGAKIHINIPVHFKNEETCPAIKKGGMLNIVLHSIEVVCSAENIPDEVVVDLAGREIGDSVHTNEIGFGKGVEVAHPERDETLATLVAPSSVKSAGEEEIEGEAEIDGTEAAKEEGSSE